MEKTLKEKTTSALIWSFIDKFGQQIIYLATGIVLGRILSPDDYGLVGMLVFFTAISTILIGSGYSRALMNQSAVSQDELNSVFYYNILMGILLYLLLYFCAPFISVFFKQPSLTLLSRVLFVSIIFTAFTNVQDFVLTKKMDLNSIAKANVFSLLPASLLAMIAAIFGFGVWALV
ncbi:MAG: oligosaccharide flippase family protein, partial [Bacteroidales bacterium]|nr:oligosaccharide flippase family protein [Bacteroidales bacterium]